MERLALALMLLVLPGQARADPVLPPIWSDGAVVQAGQPVQLWGRADPGERITASLGQRRGATRADAEGRWRVTLPALAASREAMTLTVSSDQGARIIVRDILVGGVWIAAGQSNMEFPIEYADEGYDAFIEINAPQIRFFVVEKRQTLVPQDDATGTWIKLTPRSAPKVSAVGFFFARELAAQTGGAVGMIQASYGGTPIEAWTARDVVEAPDYDAVARQAWQAALAREIERRRAAAIGLRREWAVIDPAMKVEALARLAPTPWPAQTSTARMASVLYNGMLYPLRNYAASGLLWYQGETNRADGAGYGAKLTAFLRSIDQLWGARPVAIVQTAPYAWPIGGDPEDMPLQWAAQAQVARARPGTGLIPTIDIADRRDLHPRRKRFIGERLAWWAAKTVHGLTPPAFHGPMLRDVEAVPGGYRIRFDHSHGLHNRAGAATVAMEVQQANRHWQRIEGRIEQDSVVISDATGMLQAVRYQWTRDAQPDLLNADGVPAWPFRTVLPLRGD